MISIAANDDPFKKEALLRQIGVTEDVLLSALDAGDSGAAQCTPNHPPMAPGFYRFSETVASLAIQLGPLGWTRHDYKNFSTVVSPDERFAIAVASGDAGTGELDLIVSTKSPKGVTTTEAIAQNLKLPFDSRYEALNKKLAEVKDNKVQTTTFFLLHDRRDGFRFAELSRPQSIDAKGHIQTWEPRIPLTKRSLDPVVIEDSGDLPTHSIVNIKKRERT